MAEGRSSGRVSHRVVALSSAAVLAVYAAGYQRTRQAADRFDVSRRRVASAPETPAPQLTSPGAALSAPPAPADIRPAPLAATTPTQEAAARPGGSTSPAPEPSGTAARAAAPATTTALDVTTTAPGTAATAVAAAPPSAESVTPAVPSSPAPSLAQEPAAVATHDEPRYQDGTFLGWGSCRHGDIQASVVIEGGRITSTSIAQCLTRYSCKWIEGLLPQVVDRQSARLDVVSGATESTEAFEDAVLDALAKAK